MNPCYPDVAARAEKRCKYCRAPERIFNFALEVEHILPRSLGGQDDLDNLALSCESCNLHKSVAISGWDEHTKQNASLFHPRRDLWSDHFRFDGETGLVQGTTPAGRATIVRLKINSDAQIRARHLWKQLGLYP